MRLFAIPRPRRKPSYNTYLYLPLRFSNLVNGIRSFICSREPHSARLVRVLRYLGMIEVERAYTWNYNHIRGMSTNG